MKILLTLCLVFCSGTVLFAEDQGDDIYIVCAAGYKLPIKELIVKYEASSNHKINAIFGNMQTITTYVKKSGEVSLIIGDANFIKKSKIATKKLVKLGNGKLILVYQKDINLTKPEDLDSESITRIGIPDPKKAIYGKAAIEYLKTYGLYNLVKDKLLVLKTVPQVTSYLKTGNIDVGLINVTDYEKLEGDDFKSIIISPDAYEEIIIEAGMITTKADSFYKYLQSEESKKIFKRYGL